MSLVVPPFLQCRGAIVEDVLDSLPLRAQLAYSRWLLSPLMQICIVWDGCWLLSSGRTSTHDLAKPKQLVTTGRQPGHRTSSQSTSPCTTRLLHGSRWTRMSACTTVLFTWAIAFRFAPGSSLSTSPTCWYGLKFCLTADASARVSVKPGAALGDLLRTSGMLLWNTEAY